MAHKHESKTETALIIDGRGLRRVPTPMVAVVCNECGKKWKTRSLLPTCPRCGGADVDPREEVELARELERDVYNRSRK